MKTVKQLLEERANVREQMRDLVRNAEKEGRSLNAEETARFNAWDADFERLTADWETAKKVERMRAEEAEELAHRAENEDRAHREGRAPKPENLTPEQRQAREAEVFWKAMKHGVRALNDDERRLFHSRKAELRGTNPQITVTDSLGGYLVPTGFSNELETRMKYYGGMLEACRILRTENGEVIEWPTLDDTSTTGNLTSESSPSIAVSDLTFGQKLLEAYTYDSGTIKVSVQLLQDSYFNLEEEVMARFAERLGRKLNTDLTTGDGSSKPNGIVTALNAAGRLVTAADNTTFSRTDLVDLEHGVDRAYRIASSPNVGYMMNDAIFKVIKKLSFGSSDDRPLWQTSIRDGAPDTLEGYRYWINNDMAAALANDAKTVIFGDFSKYIIRIARDTVMVPLRERFMDSLQVGYIAFMRADGELIQPHALALLRMTNT